MKSEKNSRTRQCPPEPVLLTVPVNAAGELLTLLLAFTTNGIVSEAPVGVLSVTAVF